MLNAQEPACVISSIDLAFCCAFHFESQATFLAQSAVGRMSWLGGFTSYVFGGAPEVAAPKVDARSHPNVLFACLEHVENNGAAF